MTEPETQQIQMPPVEPCRRMTEWERVLIHELVYMETSALVGQQQTAVAQQEIATLKAAYQRQGQELTAARQEIEALQVQPGFLQGTPPPYDEAESDQPQTLTSIMQEAAPPYPMPISNIHEPRRPTTAYA